MAKLDMDVLSLVMSGCAVHTCENDSASVWEQQKAKKINKTKI